MLIDPKRQPDKNIRDRFFELFGRPELEDLYYKETL